MSIPSAKYLKKKASNRLQSGNDPKKVVLVYAGIAALSSLVVTVVQDLLDSQISQTGGIQNIGTRSMLTTADTVLTIAQLLLVMCLTLGYTGSMLRIARGQYASPNSLKAGGERIWVLLRTRLLQMLIMTAAAFALCFLVVNVCLLTPLSNRVIAVMSTVSAEELLSNGLALMGLYSAMLPIILIYLVALVPLLWYFSCTYRMVDYLLIDRPQLGAFGVLRRPVSLAVRLASAFALFCLISVQAERTFERLRCPLLCRCPHTVALKGSGDRYTPPCFNKRASISAGGGQPAISARRRN